MGASCGVVGYVVVCVVGYYMDIGVCLSVNVHTHFAYCAHVDRDISSR